MDDIGSVENIGGDYKAKYELPTDTLMPPIFEEREMISSE